MHTSAPSQTTIHLLAWFRYIIKVSTIMAVTLLLGLVAFQWWTQPTTAALVGATALLSISMATSFADDVAHGKPGKWQPYAWLTDFLIAQEMHRSYNRASDLRDRYVRLHSRPFMKYVPLAISGVSATAGLLLVL